MQVTTTFQAATRDEWRSWLAANHGVATEIWLVYDDRPEPPTLAYLDSVEEALCFGWIDGIQKRISPCQRAQRFTPRRPGSHWTELNKERARRLIRLGRMTEAGHKTLPDLNQPFLIADDIVAAIQAEPGAWSKFEQFPQLYVRVRVSYIEEVRKNSAEFDRRLQNFVRKTAAGKMFGNWHDQGRLT